MKQILRTAGILLIGASAAMAQGGGSPLLPSGANFRGKTFNDWNVLSTEWTIATGLGEQSLPDTVQGVRFLSGAFTPGAYVFHVQIKPGTALVFPSFFVFGERYADGTVDDPVELAELIQFIYETTFIETKVDGKVVLRGFGSELADYQYGVTYFDAPIDYAEPQPREGFPDAVAALWTFGVGAVYHPLPAGKHILEARVDSLFFGTFLYTYHIDVVPPGKK